MIVGYRLCKTRYSAASGQGARQYGGRWNRSGIAAVYAAESRALCILERFVHLVRLPHDEAFTRIVIPASVSTCEIKVQDLFSGWSDPVESPLTQALAVDTMTRHDAAVLPRRAVHRDQPGSPRVRANPLRRAGRVHLRRPAHPSSLTYSSSSTSPERAALAAATILSACGPGT